MRFIDEPTAVEAGFEVDGTVRPRRFMLDQSWLNVSDVGRQWVQNEGRHVLVMVGGHQAFELLLRRASLTWWVVRGPDEVAAA